MSTLSWIKGGIGDWLSGQNWSSGVAPGSTDSVLVNGTTASLLLLPEDLSFGLGGLVVGDAAGTLGLNGATLIVAGSVALAGAVDGPGILASDGAASVGMAGVTLGGGAVLDVGGTLTAAGTIGFGDVSGASGTVAVAAGAALLLAGAAGLMLDGYTDADGDFEVGGGALVNAGTVAKTSGLSVSEIQVGVVSSGVLMAATGTLEVESGGTLSGSVRGIGGGVVDLAAGTFVVGAAGLVLSGVVEQTGGAIAIGAGEVLTLAGSSLFGLAGLGGGAVDGPGLVQNSGTATVLTDVSTQLTFGGGVQWDNAGQFAIGGPVAIGDLSGNAVTIDNLAGGTIAFVSDYAGIFVNGWFDDNAAWQVGQGTLINAGLLVKNGGGQTSQIFIPLSNTGMVLATVGTLELDGGGTLGGSVGGVGGGVVALGAGSFALGQSGLAWGGAVALTGASIALGGGTLTLSGAPLLAGGTLVGAGTLVTNAASLAMLDLQGGAVWASQGNAVASGTVAGSGTVLVASGGSLQLAGDAAGLGESAVVVGGWLGKTAGNGVSAIAAAVTLTGTLAVQTGTVALSGGGSLGGSVIGPGVLELVAGRYAVPGVVGTTLDLVGGTIALGGGQTVALGAPLLASGGAVDGGGTLATDGVAVLSGFVSVGGGANWRVDGAASLTGTVALGDVSGRTGAVLVGGGGTLGLSAGAAIQIGTVGGQVGDGSVTVLGTLAKDAGVGTAWIGASLVSSGVVSVAGGTLRLGGGGTLSGSVLGAGTLSLAGGNLTLEAGLAIGVAALSLDGALVTLGGTLSDGGGLVLDAGTLALGGARLNQGGVTSFAGGAVSGPGTLATTGSVTVGPGAALSLSGGTWVDQGSATASGWITVADGGVVSIAAGGALLLGDDAAGIKAGALGGTLALAGMLSKSGGSGTSAIAASVQGSGSIVVQSGTLALAGGGAFGGTVSGGGTLAFSGGTMALGSGFAASAALLLDGAQLDVANLALGTLTVSGGTISVAGGSTLQVASLDVLQGAVTGGGTLATSSGTLESGATMIVGGGFDWRNAGGLTLSGVVRFGDAGGAGTLENDASLTLASGAVLMANSFYNGQWVTGAGVLNNWGTVVSDGLATVGVAIAGGGSWQAASGTLSFTGGGTLDGSFGGGAGTILLAGGVFALGASSVDIGGVSGIAGGVVALGGNQTLDLSGIATLIASEVDGGGTLLTDGVATVDALTLGNGATWTNAGSVFLAGTLIFGDAAGGTGAVLNAVNSVLALGAGALLAPDLLLPGGAGGSVTNAGLLTGPASGTATLATSATNRGVVETMGGTLAFADGLTSTGVVLLDGGVLRVTGTVSLSGVVEGAGTLVADSFLLGGTLAAEGDLVLSGPVRGGVLAIGAYSTIELENTLAATVDFVGNGAMLQLDQPSLFIGLLQGVVAGDGLVLPGLTVKSATLAGGTLTLVTTSGTLRIATQAAPWVQVMLGTDARGDAEVRFAAGPASALASTDLDGDGSSDLLLQNADGTPLVWELAGLMPRQADVLPNPGPSWHILGEGDLYGDGNADILFQNDDGSLVGWELANGQPVRGGAIGNPGTTTHLVAAADVNDDGKADLILQDDSGMISILEMNGTAVLGAQQIGNLGPNWQVVGAGDVNGDGKGDLIVRNDQDGTIAVWEMNGLAVAGGGVIGDPGTDWQVRAVGDFNADGHSDLVLQNQDGAAEIWELNGTSVIGTGSLGNFGPSWHVVSAGAMAGGAVPELIWQDSQTGAAVVWQMNGMTPVASGASLSAIGMNPLHVITGGQAPVVDGTIGDDEFDFTKVGVGLWTIADFDPVFDSIALSAVDFGGVQGLLSDLRDAPGGVLLPVTPGSTLSILGVTSTQLQAHDFLLS